MEKVIFQAQYIAIGSYIELSKGKYELEVQAQNLLGSNMFSYCGEDIFEQTIRESTDNKVDLELNLLQDVPAFESSVRNAGKSEVILDNISIKKID